MPAKLQGFRYICAYFQKCPAVLGLAWLRAFLSLALKQPVLYSATRFLALALASNFFRVIGLEGCVLDSIYVEQKRYFAV